MNVIRNGSSGSIVSAAQLALKRSGFYSGNIDGLFGPATEAAVRRFQQRNGLVRDGIVGDNTWRLLEKYLRGYFEYRLRPGDTYWLLANKYGTSVSAIMRANPDINENFLRVGQLINIPFGFSAVPTNIAYSSYLTRLVLEGLAVRFPFIEKSVCGRSVMGKDIYLMKLGTGSKSVFYNGAHHANEWITVPVLLKFIEDYALAVANGGTIDTQNARALFENVTLYVVPLVNPDGIDLVTGALTEGEFYTQATEISSDYPSIPFPDGWKANIAGTDLNLNYPAEWERAKELKEAQGFVSPAPRDYVGTEPLSEPESRAVYDLTLSNDFRLILAYHTQGEIIFWKFLDFDPPEAERIGNIMTEKSGYPLAITPEFSSYAGYKDWFIQTYNRPGYTVEAGKGVNPLPISQFNKIYRDNIGILVTGMAEV